MRRALPIVLIVVTMSLIALAEPATTRPIGEGPAVSVEPKESPFLGVAVSNLDDATRRRFATEVEQGLLVQQVQENSPAAEAGIQPGDVLIALDGEALKSAMEFASQVRSREVGEKVTIKLVRGGVGEMEVAAALTGKVLPARAGAGAGAVGKQAPINADRFIRVPATQPATKPAP